MRTRARRAGTAGAAAWRRSLASDLLTVSFTPLQHAMSVGQARGRPASVLKFGSPGAACSGLPDPIVDHSPLPRWLQLHWLQKAARTAASWPQPQPASLAAASAPPPWLLMLGDDGSARSEQHLGNGALQPPAPAWDACQQWRAGYGVEPS